MRNHAKASSRKEKQGDQSLGIADSFRKTKTARNLETANEQGYLSLARVTPSRCTKRGTNVTPPYGSLGPTTTGYPPPR